MLRMTNSAQDGEPIEIQTVGSEGIEKNAARDYPNAPGRYRLFMRTAPGQAPCCNAAGHGTTIEVTTLEEDTNDLDGGGYAIGEGPVGVQ
jgi:hypothetical protein